MSQFRLVWTLAAGFIGLVMSATAGLQSHITLPAGTTRHEDVAIYPYDPQG